MGVIINHTTLSFKCPCDKALYLSPTLTYTRHLIGGPFGSPCQCSEPRCVQKVLQKNNIDFINIIRCDPNRALYKRWSGQQRRGAVPGAVQGAAPPGPGGQTRGGGGHHWVPRIRSTCTYNVHIGKHWHILGPLTKQPGFIHAIDY